MKFESIDAMNSKLISCARCERITKFRVEVANRGSRFLGEEFWSKPVPGFGNFHSKLLILGLARPPREETGQDACSQEIRALHSFSLVCTRWGFQTDQILFQEMMDWS